MTKQYGILFVWMLTMNHLLVIAQNDGGGQTKIPRHYFHTALSIDAYRKAPQDIRDTVNRISRRLQNYGVRQLTLGFYTPLATKNWQGPDSATRNTHLLLTGTYMNFRPQFAGLQEHNLIKLGIGLRYIYNNGKKGVWFADVSPFITRDARTGTRGFFRMASTLLYSHNFTASFNLRIGVTKSFLWGNRFYLPFIGLRLGRLEKTNLSIQFPRNISLNVPFSSKFVFSAFTRPQGGLFSFANTDTLYPLATERTFHLSRYELNTGLRAEFRPGSRFTAFFSGGISTRNNLTLYSEKANKRRKNSLYDTYFYSRNFPPAVFLEAGMVFRFGKARSAYGVKNISDAIDLNNDASGITGNSGIPTIPSKREKLNLESVRDLVEFSDF